MLKRALNDNLLQLVDADALTVLRAARAYLPDQINVVDVTPSRASMAAVGAMFAGGDYLPVADDVAVLQDLIQAAADDHPMRLRPVMDDALTAERPYLADQALLLALEQNFGVAQLAALAAGIGRGWILARCLGETVPTGLSLRQSWETGAGRFCLFGKNMPLRETAQILPLRARSV